MDDEPREDEEGRTPVTPKVGLLMLAVVAVIVVAFIVLITHKHDLGVVLGTFALAFLVVPALMAALMRSKR